MLHIDLATPTIPHTRRVWRLFPGSGYVFLPEFRAQEVAFLDFPTIELPEGALSEHENTIIPRIVASQRNAEIHRKRDLADLPFVNWQEFRDVRVSKSRGRLRQAAINFYDAAVAGDLVVVPNTLQIGRVNIGMFRDAPSERVPAYVPRKYDNLPIPARRIRWIKAVDEHQLSPDLSSKLRQQHAFSLLERKLFPEVFALAYPNFRYADLNCVTIFNEEADYLDQDSAVIGLIAKLAAKACFDIDNGREPGHVPNDLSLFFERTNIEYACSQVTDIHSPGFSRFTSSKFTPLVIGSVVSIMMALALTSSSVDIGTDRHQITYENTMADAGDPCAPIVSQASQALLDSFNDDVLWKACVELRDAQRRAGIVAPMNVTEIPIPQPRPRQR